MRHWLLILAFVFLPGISAAQTTVNLSVTDTPDNQTWNNGTWSAALQMLPGFTNPSGTFTVAGGGGSSAAQSGSLSATGTASISLPANANIIPAQSVWNIRVCPQATYQCSSNSVTVTTSSPQAVALTPASIRINLMTTAPPVSAYATGEIATAIVGSQFYLLGTGVQVCSVVSGNTCSTWASPGIPSVSALPGTCTAPSSVYLTTGTQGYYDCQNGTYVLRVGGSLTGTAFNTMIDGKASYGIKANGVNVWDVSITSGSATITCPNSDCNFTSAILGQLSWATNPTTNFLAAGSLIVPQGFICTVNSAQSITVGTTFPGCAADNATATCTVAGTQACLLVFGSDDSTALTNFWNGVTGNQFCSPGILPAGDIITQSAQFNAVAGASAFGLCVLGAGNTLEGPSLYGAATAPGTTILPSPNFSSASCTGGSGSFTNGCFFSSQAITVSNITIFGSGIASIGAGFNGKAAVNLNGACSGATAFSNTYATNLVLVGWGAGTNTFIGLQTECTSQTYLLNVPVIGMGAIPCQYNDDGVSGGFVTAVMVQCVGGTGFAATNNGGLTLVNSTHTQTWNDWGGYYGNMADSSIAAFYGVIVGNNQTFRCTACQLNANLPGSTNFQLMELAGNPSTAYLDQAIISASNGIGSGIGRGISMNSGGTLYIINSTVKTTAAGTLAILTQSGASLFDEGGNTFSGVAANSIAANTIFRNDSFVGTVPVTGNFALTNATFTSVVGSDSRHFQLNITASASAAVTVAYTFPTSPGMSFAGFLAAPGSCHALQVGGNQPQLTFQNSAGPTATSVTFLSTTAATNTDTISLAVDCA